MAFLKRAISVFTLFGVCFSSGLVVGQAPQAPQVSLEIQLQPTAAFTIRQPHASTSAKTGTVLADDRLVGTALYSGRAMPPAQSQRRDDMKLYLLGVDRNDDGSPGYRLRVYAHGTGARR